MTKERNNVERDIAALLCLLTFRGPFTEELARRAINIGSDRVFHTAPDLSDQLSCATVLFPSFSLPWLDSISSVPLCLSYSPPVPLAEPFLHPDSPTHPTKTTRCKYICARFSHLSTPVSHRPLISFGHTRTRNHPIRSLRLAESIFIQP